MQPQDIAEIIDDCLRRGNPIHQGSILGAANANGKVRVELPYPLPGVGRVVTALAGNDCLGGQATLFRADSGIWYAISHNAQLQPSNSQIVRHRSRRFAPIKPVPVIYPFKILFSVVEGGLRKFYVGGDRVTPTLVHEIPASDKIWTAAITNMGEKKQDWVTGFKTGFPYNLKIVNGESETWDLNAAYNGAELCEWKGYGYWTSSIKFPMDQTAAKNIPDPGIAEYVVNGFATRAVPVSTISWYLLRKRSFYPATVYTSSFDEDEAWRFNCRPITKKLGIVENSILLSAADMVNFKNNKTIDLFTGSVLQIGDLRLLGGSATLKVIKNLGNGMYRFQYILDPAINYNVDDDIGFHDYKSNTYYNHYALSTLDLISSNRNHIKGDFTHEESICSISSGEQGVRVKIARYDIFLTINNYCLSFDHKNSNLGSSNILSTREGQYKQFYLQTGDPKQAGKYLISNKMEISNTIDAKGEVFIFKNITRSQSLTCSMSVIYENNDFGIPLQADPGDNSYYNQTNSELLTSIESVLVSNDCAIYKKIKFSNGFQKDYSFMKGSSSSNYQETYAVNVLDSQEYFFYSHLEKSDTKINNQEVFTTESNYIPSFSENTKTITIPQLNFQDLYEVRTGIDFGIITNSSSGSRTTKKAVKNFWNNFIGMEITASIWSSSLSEIIQVYGNIIDYIFLDTKVNQRDTNVYADGETDAPKIRKVSSITLNISSVTKVPYDSKAKVNKTVIYSNNGSILLPLLDKNATLLSKQAGGNENTIAGLYIPNTSFGSSDKAFKNYAEVYDFVKQPNNSEIQVVKRKQPDVGAVTGLKYTPTEIHSVSYFPV